MKLLAHLNCAWLRQRGKFFLLLFCLFATTTSLFACAACTGKSDSDMAKSLNAGIFSLLAVVATVLAGAASFFVFLARKAASSNSSETAAELPKLNSQT
jgi:hypothetical protein